MRDVARLDRPALDVRRYQAKLVRAKANLAEARRQQAALKKLETDHSRDERRIGDLKSDLTKLRVEKVRPSLHWLLRYHGCCPPLAFMHALHLHRSASLRN